MTKSTIITNHLEERVEPSAIFEKNSQLFMVVQVEKEKRHYEDRIETTLFESNKGYMTAPVSELVEAKYNLVNLSSGAFYFDIPKTMDGLTNILHNHRFKYINEVEIKIVN